jgi:hypothetical protein
MPTFVRDESLSLPSLVTRAQASVVFDPRRAQRSLSPLKGVSYTGHIHAKRNGRRVIAATRRYHYFFRVDAPYFFALFAFCLFSTTTCAAANREIGTRNGDALT